MKKILIIVLLMCFVVSTGIVALAELKFGVWNGWDKFFLPLRFWGSQMISNKTYAFSKEVRFENLSMSIMHLGFYDSSNSKRMSAVVLSPTPEKKVDEDLFYTFDYQFAIAAFPPKRGKVTVIAYKKEGHGLLFFEQWEVPYEDSQYVFSKEAEFTGFLRKWLEDQEKNTEAVDKIMSEIMSLKLITFGKNRLALLLESSLENQELVDWIKTRMMEK